MPISNECRMQMEFSYEFPFPGSPTGEGLVFPLRFHHTAELGATITFLDQEGKPTEFHLPAEMFGEVAEYLAEKGIIEGRHVQIRQPSQPVSVSSGTRLGLPIINRGQGRASAVTVHAPSSEKMRKIHAAATPIEVEQPEEDEAETPPQDDQTFIPSGIKDGLESVADIEPLQSFTPEGEEAVETEASAPEKPARKPRLAAQRAKLSVSDLRAARASTNSSKRIKPL